MFVYHTFEQEEGFSYTELNASASRGKKTLQFQVAGSLGSLSMDAFASGLKDTNFFVAMPICIIWGCVV